MKQAGKSSSKDQGGMPICVDLDGTLILSDTLHESVILLVKKNILYLLLLPFWLFKGKAYLKSQIAMRVRLPVEYLPYQPELLEYLRQQHAKGRHLVLATAANSIVASDVADYLGIFAEIISSDSSHNLSAKNKLKALQDKYSQTGFEYIGNSHDDVIIFRNAASSILVNPLAGVVSAVDGLGNISRVVISDTGNKFSRYSKSIRVHQWLKNLLIFVPMVLAHEIYSYEPALIVLAGFIAFSLCASAIYLLNDLLDIFEDRKHPNKQHRMLASGFLPISHAVIMIPVLLSVSLLMGFYLSTEFLAVLAVYLLLTVAYSLVLKRIALVDVLTLALLYTVRIIAGVVVIAVDYSFWLLAFSMFLFLSLAMVKRYTEIMVLREDGKNSLKGRGYISDDLAMLANFGTSSAYMSVLVLALYINSDAIKAMYTYPQVIWLLCPLLLYLVMRIWFMASRNRLHDDPVVFLLEDINSQLALFSGLVLLWVAI